MEIDDVKAFMENDAEATNEDIGNTFRDRYMGDVVSIENRHGLKQSGRVKEEVSVHRDKIMISIVLNEYVNEDTNEPVSGREKRDFKEEIEQWMQSLFENADGVHVGWINDNDLAIELEYLL